MPKENILKHFTSQCFFKDLKNIFDLKSPAWDPGISQLLQRPLPVLSPDEASGRAPYVIPALRRAKKKEYVPRIASQF